MPFNIGLTGIRAADTDLQVTGNNIANASTTGFKRSRAEFGDIYANSILGAGSNVAGSGVNVSDIAQQFTQGNVAFTDNSLDLAIDGGGFFVLSDGGDLNYSRSGMFTTDRNGFIINNSGFNLQGYASDANGNIINGVLTDLQIDTTNQQPQPTSRVDSQLNLDARQSAPVDAVFSTTNSTQTLAISSGDAATTAPINRLNGVAPGDLNIQTVVSTDTISFDPATFTDAPAAQIADYINTQSQNNSYGVSANANTAIRLDGLTTADGNIINIAVRSTGGTAPNPVPAITLQTPGGGVPSHLQQIVNGINNAGLPGLSASLNTVTNDIEIRSSNGDDLIVDGITGNMQSLTVSSDGNLEPLVPDNRQTIVATDYYTVAGEVSLTVDDGVSVSDPAGTDPFWGGLQLNTTFNFVPTDPDTYNDATSLQIYDSLGNPHTMTQYFVKQRTNPLDPDQTANRWDMYVMIDGKHIGNPLPGETTPTPQVFNLRFNNNGSLDPVSDVPLEITNWTPLDGQGNYNGALGPNNQAVYPFPDPPTSSNFFIDVGGTTQFGSEFSVDDQDQDGFTTGRLAGLDVDDRGIVFARFTNGQAQVLGQVALASFTNEQGLQPQGDTAWAETADSGPPLIGAPQTASLGQIKSSALEDSNVDLSQELVNMIIAQRNYQANAKTIETADQVTQTILNI